MDHVSKIFLGKLLTKVLLRGEFAPRGKGLRGAKEHKLKKATSPRSSQKLHPLH